MIAWILSRLAHTIMVLAGLTTLVFILLRVLPGDPVELMAGELATPVERETMAEAMGLNKPLSRQWLEYVTALAHGDLGNSLHSGRPVREDIARKLPATIMLGIYAMAVAIALAMPIGIIGALRANSMTGHIVTGFSLLGVAIPNFWLGPLLILVFSYHLGWFPVSGSEQAWSWVLPAVTLGTGMAAIQAGLLRQSLVEQMGSTCLLAAMARGLSYRQAVLRHILRLAMLPVVTVLGLQLGALLTGVIVTERIFAWPGLGSLLIEAISARDYPVVQGCVLLMSVIYVVVNMLTDIVYRCLDPRIRLSAEAR